MTRADRIRAMLAAGWHPQAVAFELGIRVCVVEETRRRRSAARPRPPDQPPESGITPDIRRALAVGRITLREAARRAGLSVAELKRALYGPLYGP